LEDKEEELLEKISKQSEDVKAKLLTLRQRRKEIKDELRQLNKIIKSLEMELPKLTLEISGCDTTRRELSKLIPQLREQCQVSDEDSRKRATVKANISQCKSDMTSCVSLADKLEEDVSNLQKEILDAGGPRLKLQKENCEKILSALNDAEKALNSAKVEIVSADKSIMKVQNSLESMTKQLEECVATLFDKSEELKSLENETITVLQAYDEVKEIEEKKKKDLESAFLEVDYLKKSHSELQYTEIDLCGKLDALQKQICEYSKKAAHWKNEIARIQLAEEEFDLNNELEEDEATEAEADPDQNDEENKESVQQDMEMEDAESKKIKTTSVHSFKISYASLEKYDMEDLKETITTLQNERNLLAKNANMGAIAEYRKKEADYLARVAELDQVTEERNNARKEHEELRRQRLEMFMEGFGAITLKLKEMYQMITLGGDAELELVDSLDPFSEGIVFSVRPPKKSWKNISNLSGGEKTLSSLSLVFALHHFRPTPLYVMDEIDAALDFKNVSIVGNYIKERTRNAQFIIISLRNNMFELADRLCGIYKVRNMTNSVTINPKAFGARAAAPLMDSSNIANKSSL
jgi:structural maintenance of chromosome 4